MHTSASPSPWVRRWLDALALPPQASGLDLACGHGRHAQLMADKGLRVCAIDRDADALSGLQHPNIETLCADLENGAWPLTQRNFDVVVVCNYLWRPTWPHLMNTVKPGGYLIYETFATGNETVGKPSRPDFLLQTNELLQRCQDWHIVAYENGFLSQPDRFVQRIAAQRPNSALDNFAPARHALCVAE